jgi:hypothetical protein
VLESSLTVVHVEMVELSVCDDVNRPVTEM